MAKELWKGNHAIAEAALRAGTKLFAGYPITPQTEVGEWLAYREPQVEGFRYLQAENEIAASHMLHGAGSTGIRCMTSSSGPGFTLKLEAIGFLCANWVPALFINVVRWGSGIGSLDSAQTDYLRDTRVGANGDNRLIIYTPNSVQETVDLIYNAYEVAEKYRNPVEILTEGTLGQMMEPVEFPPFKEGTKPEWAWDGSGRGQASYWGRPRLPEKPAAMKKKIAEMEENEQRWENYKVEDAEYVFVAFGVPSRSTKVAVDRLREAGEKVGLLRPITVWPFPYKAFEECKAAKGFISVEETDSGQLIEDVALACKRKGFGNAPVYGMFTGQHTPTTQDVIDYYYSMKAGNEKEVF